MPSWKHKWYISFLSPVGGNGKGTNPFPAPLPQGVIAVHLPAPSTSTPSDFSHHLTYQCPVTTVTLGGTWFFRFLIGRWNHLCIPGEILMHIPRKCRIIFFLHCYYFFFSQAMFLRCFKPRGRGVRWGEVFRRMRDSGKKAVTPFVWTWRSYFYGLCLIGLLIKWMEKEERHGLRSSPLHFLPPFFDVNT